MKLIDKEAVERLSDNSLALCDKHFLQKATRNLVVKEVLSLLRPLPSSEEIAKVLWEVSRDQLVPSLMVKPWSETKQEVKEFYLKQADAIRELLEGKK
jgi:Tfp pilus assembly protein PilO